MTAFLCHPVFQRSFKPSHHHSIVHTGDTFFGGRYHHCGRSRQNNSLADLCVSGDLMFWRSTERLANWRDDPYTQGRQKWMH